MARSVLDQDITRRRLLKSGAGTGLGLALGLSCDGEGQEGPRPESPRPNVVVITLDALRAISLPMYGCPRNTSPFMQELASQSTLYEFCYSSATWTRPAVVGMLTGLLPHQHDSNHVDVPLPPSVTSFGQVASEAGYHTGFFTANAIIGESFGMEEHFARASWDAAEGVSGEKLISECEQWLSGLGSGPICAYFHIFQPHAPYDPPEAFVEEALRQGRAQPPSGEYLEPHQRDVDISLGGLNILGRIPYYEALVTGSRDPLHYVLMYEANILYADSIVRDLIGTWKRLRPGERTIFILTSDHGESFGEQSCFCDHGKLLQETMLRVPLIIHDTGNPRRERFSTPVSHLELPTAIARWVGSDRQLGFYGSNSVISRTPRREIDRSIVSQQLSYRRGGLGPGEAGWALTRAPWRLVYNDAPFFGNYAVVSTIGGDTVHPDRPRVPVPIAATALQRPTGLAPGVSLENLGFHLPQLDPAATQRISGRLRVSPGAEGTLLLRANLIGDRAIDLARVPCQTACRLDVRVGPIDAPGGFIEAAWIPDASSDPGFEPTWQPLFPFVTYAPVDIDDDIEVIGCTATPPAALAGREVRASVTFRLTRPMSDLPEIRWQWVDDGGKVVRQGECTGLRAYVKEKSETHPNQIRQLLRQGYRFQEEFRIQLPTAAIGGKHRIEVGTGSEGQRFTVATVTIASSPDAALEGLVASYAPIEAFSILSSRSQDEIPRGKKTQESLRQVGRRYPSEGQIPFLLAQHTDDRAKQRALLLDCLAKTPFHRAALERVGLESWGGGHAGTLGELTPSRTCHFEFDRTLLLYGFDLEKVGDEGGDHSDLDLTLYWESATPTRRILMADLWTNSLKLDGTSEAASLSWFIGGDRHPNNHLKFGEALKETVRITLRKHQQDLPLTLVVYPYWQHAFGGLNTKDSLDVIGRRGKTLPSARLGDFSIDTLETSPRDRLRAKRLDKASYRLYDIASDPFERTSLVHERPDVFASLQSELIKLLEVSDQEGSAGETPRRKMSEGLSDELRALGYIE